MNCSADCAANAASKRATCTCATPALASSSSLSRRRVMRAGAAAGLKYSRGCGSKVRTHAVRLDWRALAITRSTSARWPRCTPSKLPIVSAHRPRARCKEPCVTTMDSVKTLNYSAFMKKLEDQMAIYAAYHQDARNKATHFVGVPIIVLSLYIPLAWLRLDVGGWTITAAILLGAVVVAYYLVLDVRLGLAMLVVFAALAWLGQQIAGLGALPGWSW